MIRLEFHRGMNACVATKFHEFVCTLFRYGEHALASCVILLKRGSSLDHIMETMP